MNNQNTQHALLPIHIIKKSANGNIVGQKSTHFQINVNNTYDINYKFFMPRGYHLANYSTSKVDCRLVNGHLNVPSVTFTYIQNDGSVSDDGHLKIRFLDSQTGRLVSQVTIRGRKHRSINVLHHTSLPVGYQLLSHQKLNLVVQDHPQVINLLVRPTSTMNYSSRSVKSVRKPDRVRYNGANQVFDQNDLHRLHDALRAYDQKLGHYLWAQLLTHDFHPLQKVVKSLMHHLGYQDVNRIRVDSVHHKIVGPAHRSVNSSDQIAYLRARKYHQHQSVSVVEIREFVTCVMDNHAHQGIFITTSDFSTEAQREAKLHHITMIDGKQLVHFMIRNRIGTTVKQNYQVISPNSSFFANN